MSDVKWIKIVTDLFEDEKILLIESLPEADSILVVWLKLLCLAGKTNNSGVFMLSERIPYTERMLATVFRRKESTVQLALKTFEEFGMIEIYDGTVMIPNWSKYQSLDAIEKKREYDRKRMQKIREDQRLKAIVQVENQEELTSQKEEVARQSYDSRNDVALQNKNKKENDINKNNINKNKDSLVSLDDEKIKTITEKWNQIGGNVKPVKSLSKSSTRYKNLDARVQENGLEAVLEAIELIKKSDFLLGLKADWAITFNWFVNKTNFEKVYEEQYTNNATNKRVHQENARLLEYEEYEKHILGEA